jgi:hypothetical protein
VKFAKTICQSCASPILQEYDKGKERNGRFSDIYCRRCFQFGAFTDPQMTAERMHENVRIKMIEMKFPRFLASLMANQVYTLKRWETVKV